MTLKNQNLEFKITLYMLLTVILLMSCKPTNNDIALVSDSTPEINISYNLPVDVAVNASQEELAKFAWEEFFALNWKSSWKENSLRTTPDTTWTYTSDTGADFLSVWETYIHRAELRPANGKRTKDLSSGSPYYTFVDSTSVNVTNPVQLDNYFNVLDEDNEIGSAYVFAHKNEFEVLYAAKTNLVEYNYLKNNFQTDKKLYKAIDKSNDSTSFRSRLRGLSKQQMCDSEGNTSDGYVCLPCSTDANNEGAIEIKLAFRELDPNKDDASRYMVKEAVYFKDSVAGNKTYSNAYVKQFALIGMHIIRKTQNHPTFVFASWEQVDERNNDVQTIGIDTVTVNGEQYSDVDPHRLNPVIERVIPETLQKVNTQVQKMIAANSSKSKWQYYQLIGVQGNPIYYKDRTSDNNYFMANFVIESDLKLTNFHGSFGDPFDTKIKNVISDGKQFNMGGCMGCHGQGQTTFGTDFSFLLDSGAGKPVIRPDPYQTFDEALFAAQNKKIQALIREFDKKQ
ncbi:hypothetical protein [Tenacibaculum sp. 190524A05c]|uniref:hypothetical protein n=1 Tax=Tenacibaculum platacis TaxID=3137852 RepID=UPI0031FB27BA